MKSFKCLMGVVVSTVLLISTVLAGNAALSQDVKDGLVKKGQISIFHDKVSLEELNANKDMRTIRVPSTGNANRDCTDCEFDFTAYGSECRDSAWDEYGINCADLQANYSWDC